MIDNPVNEVSAVRKTAASDGDFPFKASAMAFSTIGSMTLYPVLFG
jgi:hypothetical protein